MATNHVAKWSTESRNAVFAACLAAFLPSCGGGGDNSAPVQSGSPVPAPPPAPTPAPPDPTGLDRSSSIRGVDSDANGVRDDIDNMITALAPSAEAKTALVTVARTLQGVLDLGSQPTQTTVSVRNASLTLNKALACLAVASPKTFEQDSVLLLAATANTLPRFTAYLTFVRASDAVLQDTVNAKCA